MLTLGFILLAAIYIFTVPNKGLKVFFSIYFLVLYITLGGFLGFLQGVKDKENGVLILVTFYSIIFIIHLPLVIKIRQLNRRPHRIKKAREIFGNEVLHLSNDQLHLHLKKHH